VEIHFSVLSAGSREGSEIGLYPLSLKEIAGDRPTILTIEFPDEQIAARAASISAINASIS
jgi:hypothetical protein